MSRVLERQVGMTLIFIKKKSLTNTNIKRAYLLQGEGSGGRDRQSEPGRESRSGGRGRERDPKTVISKQF